MSTFTFGAYDFLSLIEEEQPYLNQGIYHLGSEPLIEEKQKSDMEEFVIFFKEEAKQATILFKENELRTIVQSSLKEYYSLLIFTNAHEFMFEDGSPVNTVYSSKIGETVIYKIKPISGSPTLEIHYESGRYSERSKVDVVYNIFDVAVKFQDWTKGMLIIMSSVESEIYIVDNLGSSCYSRRGSYFKIISGIGILAFNNLTQLPIGAQIGRFTLNKFKSEFDNSGLIIRDGEVRTITVNESSVNVYPYHYLDYQLCHFYSESELAIEKIDYHYNIRSYNGTQNVTIVMEGLYENTFTYMRKSFNFAIDALSDKPIGYRIRKMDIPQEVYSFYSFSTNITCPDQVSFNVTAWTNDRKVQKYIVEPGQTLTLKSINLLIFDPIIRDITLTRIIFDEPDKAKRFGNLTYDFLYAIWPPQTPNPTPERTLAITTIRPQTTAPEEVITPNNDQGNDQKSKSGKLGAGAIAGIIIGILIIAAVCIGAFLIIKKHQLKVEKDSEDQVQFMNMV
ncbi:hypothetical protein TVAG_198160 [Trichomonas vaginalis G3]|uniref:Transmembrane protein n=2 Tax=Trichomonas vaginalis (strain ATCC PRA-98 / G3) TaxID=412133 RepID=A2DDK3_TRIV3|nr:hypothetical protein TVAG_198160 [Trichomonas vaginalis G3]|eukprot:XP_001582365.1 hypothetical protein [Trichomonas vaginalis G3]